MPVSSSELHAGSNQKWLVPVSSSEALRKHKCHLCFPASHSCPASEASIPSAPHSQPASGGALANGDDTLSITSAITAALLACYTSSQVDALLGDYRTGAAQDTQTQAAIAGALLAYRTGPDQDVFTTNQITLALVAYRSAADQDTATASSITAALLSYYTITQVDGLLAGKLGVTEAALALQIAVRFPDDGGADEVVAAIGEQILAPTDVSLSNWTVRPTAAAAWSWLRTPRE